MHTKLEGARFKSTSRERRAALVLALVLFGSYAYFYGAGGWNQNSRFALVRAMLERHTLQIDAYQLHTGDRAILDGHYYSDKAPGASMVALVPVFLARGISRAAGVDPEGFPGIAWTSYIATVVTSGVFTVIAALAVFWLSLRWGATLGGALFAASAYGLASPAWAYATLFMAHGQTAGCLMLECAAADALGSAARDTSMRASARLRGLPWIVGLSGGWAVVTEFQAAIPAIVIGLLALDGARQSSLSRAESRGSERRVALSGVIGPIAAGIAIAVAPLFVYNALAFGSPLHLGYSSEESFKEMRTGFFGITYPKLDALRELLIGRFRGLLPLAPLMAVAPFGLIGLMRGKRMAPALVAAAIAVYYLLLNASYFFWEGGWAFGPRQLTPGLPFLALGLAPLWDRSRQIWRVLLVAGWIWGAGLTLIAVSTTPQPPASMKDPVRELLWPAFRDGDLSLNPQTFVHNSVDVSSLRGGASPHAAWNLGEVAGLRGLPSLLPLLCLWIVAAALLRL